MSRLNEAVTTLALAVVFVVVLISCAYSLGALLGWVAAGFRSTCGC